MKIRIGRSARATPKASPTLFILFSLPFTAAGILTGWMAFSSVTEWSSMKHWTEVPCIITQADLVTSRGSDSTMYKATASYRYTVDGQTYTGDRVSLRKGYDNIGSFQRDTAQLLKRYKASGDTVRCYVDPQNPDHAILFRNFPAGLFFFMLLLALVFGGVGIGVLVAGIASRKSNKATQTLKTNHPEAPWMWNPDWAEGRIRAASRATMIGIIAFAVLWNLISSPILFLLRSELTQGNKLALIALLFPLVGVGLIIAALRAIIRHKKFGNSTFQMASVPGVLGGQLAGVIRVGTHLRPADGFHITLSCIHRFVSGTGKSRSTKETIQWQDEKIMDRELLEHDFSQTAIPVQFVIPFDCQPTESSNPNDRFLWRLEVSAAVPGVDYCAIFEVPVFRTAESSPDVDTTTSQTAAFEREVSSNQRLAQSGIRILRGPGGEHIYYSPPFRNIGASLGLTGFLAFWTVGLVLTIKFGAPLLFPIVLSLVDVILVAVVIEMWFGIHRLTVGQQGITLRRGPFGLWPAKNLDRNDIEAVDVNSGMQSGKTVYYSITLVSGTGRGHCTVASRIRNKAAAEAVADAMRSALALT